MCSGQPDRKPFDTNFCSMLRKVRQRANNQNRGLTVYGECVSHSHGRMKKASCSYT